MQSGEADGGAQSLTREEFNAYLDAFIMHHPSLEKYMGKDEGIKLMYQDSLIVEELIRNFTAREIPILCVHDSIIVQEKYLDLAREEMKKATVKLLGVELDFDQNRVTKDLVYGTRGFKDTQFTASYWEALNCVSLKPHSLLLPTGRHLYNSILVE